MKRLVSISPPHIDRHRLIVDAKSDAEVKKRLKAQDAVIASRYAAFENAVARNRIQDFPESHALQARKKDLLSCYAIKTKNLRNLLEEIKQAQPNQLLGRCPYCGITLPTTYDHYLPESKYPDLVVHGLNVLPCCSSCNQTKGKRWRNGSQRLFIHFYSDAIPDWQFLRVSLVPAPARGSLGATFVLRRPRYVTVRDWSLIENHYSELDLLTRYTELSSDEIAYALGACVDHICDGGRDAATFLRRMADRLEAVFGRNHWRVVIYRALAVSRIFLDIVGAKVALEC